MCIRLLSFFHLGSTGFVDDAVFGAEGGCVGLEIQNNCEVHLLLFLMRGIRGTGHTP
jgi:hypothetical protein